MLTAILIVLLLVGGDQIVKYLVSSHMTVGQSIPVVGDLFRLTLVHNRGAAFDTFEGMRSFLTFFPLILILGCLVFIWIKRKDIHPVLLVSLSLIAGGGVGNLIDRFRLGYVVDMLDIRILPVFNVADMGVVIGCGLLCLYVLFIEGRKDRV